MNRPRCVSSIFLFLLLLFVSIPRWADGFYDWSYTKLPTSLLPLPRLRLGTSFSLAGSSISFGTANQQSLFLCVQRANELGGVWHNGRQYAVTLQSLSDVSSPDLVLTIYDFLTAQVGWTTNQTARPVVPSGNATIVTPGNMLPLDILFAPHTTELTLPALLSARNAASLSAAAASSPSQINNVTLYTVGANSLDAYSQGYPYIWSVMALANTWMLRAYQLLLTPERNVRTAALLVRPDSFGYSVLNFTLKIFEQKGIEVQFIAYLPLTYTTTDPRTTQWMQDQLTSFDMPYSVDMLLLIGRGSDQLEAARALKLSGKAPKMCVYSQAYDESSYSVMRDAEGWIGTFSWREEKMFNATLDGVLFKSNDEFVQYARKNLPTGVQLTSIHAQHVGAFEGMLAALNTSASLSSIDMRQASLALDGSTFYTQLKYDSNTGANLAQDLMTYQIQRTGDADAAGYDDGDGNDFTPLLESAEIRSQHNLVYPYQWPWIRPRTYSQTHTEFGLMIISAIYIFFLILLFLLMLLVKSTRVIHAASPSLLFIVLGSNILIILSTVFLLLVPNTSNCSVSAWLFNIGFTSTLGAFFLKLYRLNQIFNSKVLEVKRRLTDKLLISILACMILFDSVLLLIKTVVSPYTNHPTIQICQYAADISHSTLDLTNALSYILIISKGLLLLSSALLCFLTRTLPSLYNESVYIAFTVYNNSIISLIWLVVRYAFGSSSDNRASRPGEDLAAASSKFYLIYVEYFAMLLGSLLTILLVFLPKLSTLHKQGEFQLQGNDRTNAALNRTFLGGGDAGNRHHAEKLTELAGKNANAIVGANGQLTLPIVMRAISNLRQMLENQLDAAYRSVKNAQKKVAEAKYEVLVVRQQIALIRAEEAYMRDVGIRMSEEQLEAMIRERTSQSKNQHSFDYISYHPEREEAAEGKHAVTAKVQSMLPPPILEVDEEKPHQQPHEKQKQENRKQQPRFHERLKHNTPVNSIELAPLNKEVDEDDLTERKYPLRVLPSPSEPQHSDPPSVYLQPQQSQQQQRQQQQQPQYQLPSSALLPSPSMYSPPAAFTSPNESTSPAGSNSPAASFLPSSTSQQRPHSQHRIRIHMYDDTVSPDQSPDDEKKQ